MTTTIPYTVIADKLHQDLLALYPRQVFRGAPLDRAGAEFFAIGGIEEGLNDWAVMRAGRKPANGSFKLIVNIIVHRGGNSPAESELEALARLNAIENLVANDPRIGLSIPSLRMIISDYELDSFQSGERRGWTTEVVVKILCEFRRT